MQYLLGIMHILELKENNSNISSKMVNKTVMVTVHDLTKMHGPHQMANWNTSEHRTAGHHSNWCGLEYCHTNQFATPPLVIHIFWPFMMYSSPFFSARVFTPLTSDPAPGSVKQKPCKNVSKNNVTHDLKSNKIILAHNSLTLLLVSRRLSCEKQRVNNKHLVQECNVLFMAAIAEHSISWLWSRIKNFKISVNWF